MITMTVCGTLHAKINLPAAIKDKGDRVHGLPPHHEVAAYPVDTYPASPQRWMRGGPTVSSYFVGVEAGRGMWLDLNECCNHTHDVAALISIQGVNPITGQKAYGQGLQQYLTKCPVHDAEFGQDRFCPECKFKWPKQNYLATTGTPHGAFWLDGFRSEDGKVRQYVFTEEELRGIAAQVVGEERVFAIGIAFYLSKEPKPPRPQPVMRSNFMGSGLIGSSGMKKSFMSHYSGTPTYGASLSVNAFHSVTESDNADAVMCSVSSMGPAEPEEQSDAGPGPDAQVKQLEVAAGARIDQRIHDDPKDLSYWKDEPEGLIVVNYVQAAQLAEILAAGKREEKPGFMAGMTVGNA